MVTCVVCDTAHDSTRVLRRSFAGSKAVYIVCVAVRPSEAPCAGSAGLTRVPRHPRTLLISCDAGRVPDSVHQEAMWPNCVARVHAHARPRRSEREGLESRGKFFVRSTPQAIMRRRATRVLRGSRGSHAGPAGPTRVPCGSLAGPFYTARVPHTVWVFKILLRREGGSRCWTCVGL